MSDADKIKMYQELEQKSFAEIADLRADRLVLMDSLGRVLNAFAQVDPKPNHFADVSYAAQHLKRIEVKP